MAVHTYRIVGFLDDTFLQKTDSFLTIGKSKDQGAGTIDSILTDYFNIASSIKDRRGGRSVLLSAAAPSYTQMTLWFDSYKILPQDLWMKISANNYTRLFSIIELVELTQNASAGYMNALLQQDEVYKDIYVKDTLFISSKRVPVEVKLSANTIIDIPEWFSFRVKIAQEDDIFDFTFKIYLGRESFVREYDITTITKVVPPCDPIYFFTATDYTSNIDAIIKSVAFGTNMLNEAIASTDQQGVYAFYTKYVMDKEHAYRIPFQILHRGPKVPTTLECRKAIKEYLMNTGLANEDTVKERFPELFIDCQYYIIPLYDWFTDRPDRVIYPAVTPKLTDIFNIMTRFVNDSQDVFSSKAQLILNAKNDMFSVVYPHPLNAIDITIDELFPTYSAYSTHSTEFEYMDPQDKEFARQLIRTFSLIDKTLTASDVIITNEDERIYVTFTSGRAEFHVMTPDSYLERR